MNEYVQRIIDRIRNNSGEQAPGSSYGAWTGPQVGSPDGPRVLGPNDNIGGVFAAQRPSLGQAAQGAVQNSLQQHYNQSATPQHMSPRPSPHMAAMQNYLGGLGEPGSGPTTLEAGQQSQPIQTAFGTGAPPRTITSYNPHQMGVPTPAQPQQQQQTLQRLIRALSNR